MGKFVLFVDWDARLAFAGGDTGNVVASVMPTGSQMVWRSGEPWLVLAFR